MRVITLDANKKIISIKNVGNNYGLEPNDLEANSGEMGQIMQEDGTFITPIPEIVPQPYQPTNTELAQMISDLQADLVIAGVI